jgi:solute carrier family 35 protein C2
MLSRSNNDDSNETQQEVEHFKDIDDEDSDDDLELISSSSATATNKLSSRSSFQTKLDWFKLYLISILPCAFATANDIGMGNVSLRFVTLTFYTMVKSSSLAWVLLFGILFKLEIPTRKLVGIIGVMTIGVVMMVAGETNFVLVGFLLVLGAAVFSGLRWSLTQILLRNSGGINTHNDPVRTIMYISPIMGLFLFIMGGILEGYGAVFRSSLWTDKGVLGGIGIVILPGLLAFLMTLSEFMLLGRTSVLTLSIAGIFKELVTIVSASLWFHDRMTLVNFIGLVITLSAIVAYNIYRYRATVV